MAEERPKRWLVAKRKRNRDIRDFVAVHGKIVKPCVVRQVAPLTHEHPSSCPYTRETETGKRRQVQLSQFPETSKEAVKKVPASLCSKGVRKKKAPLTEIRENSQSSHSPGTSVQLTGPVDSAGDENDEWRESSHNTCSTRADQRFVAAVDRDPGKENSSNTITLKSVHVATVIPQTPVARVDLISHTYSSSPLLFEASPPPSDSPHHDSPSLTLSWDTDALLAELASCEKLCDDL